MRLMLILRRRCRRGGEIVTPSTWHPQFLRSSERVGTGRMSESSQRVGTGRTPLALRNKETFVPGDLQCLNHRSCESVLLIPPPSGPPRPTIITTEHHSWDQTVDQTVFVNKRNKWDQTQTPFSVCSTPGGSSVHLWTIRRRYHEYRAPKHQKLDG